MARRYTRDARGRFSSGGGGGSRGGGSKPIQRGTNRLTRDNAGRITSQGGNGATARGGRLATASGNKRQMQTAKLSGGGPKGTVGKPKDLKPGAMTGKVKPRDAARRANQLNDRASRLEKTGNRLMSGGRNDRAATNVSLNNRARRNETSAGFRGLEMTRTASKMRSRAGNVEARAAQSSAKALRDAAKPKRTRGQESLRMSRAKQVEKRRHDNIKNPAAWRQESAGRMAANAQRTQEKALAFYKSAGKAKKPAVGKPAAAKGRTIGHSEAYARRTEAQLRRGIETGKRAQAYLSSKDAYKAPIGSKLSNAWGKAGRVEWGSRNALNSIANKRLNEARKKRTGGFS